MKVNLFIFSIILASFLVFTNAESISVKDMPEYDWLICGSTMQQVNDSLNMTLSWEEMYPLCYDLINNHKILIERDNERDILIYWVNLGDTVQIPLP